MWAFKIFLDSLPKEKAEKCVFVLHTEISHEAGTDLKAVEELFPLNLSFVPVPKVPKTGAPT